MMLLSGSCVTGRALDAAIGAWSAKLHRAQSVFVPTFAAPQFGQVMCSGILIKVSSRTQKSPNNSVLL